MDSQSQNEVKPHSSKKHKLSSNAKGLIGIGTVALVIVLIVVMANANKSTPEANQTIHSPSSSGKSADLTITSPPASTTTPTTTTPSTAQTTPAVVTPVPTTAPSTPSCSPVSEAASLEGTSGCIEFTGYAYTSSRGEMYLDQSLSAPYGFSAYIPAGTSFGPGLISEYSGQPVDVTGAITSYDGEPEIIVTSASQIQHVE